MANPNGSGKVVILSIESLSGANSTENNTMTVVGVVDRAVFNQDELISSMIAVKKYGTYIIPISNIKDIKDVPTVEYAGETYVFGAYTLSASAATTYRKGTVDDFVGFIEGNKGPNGGGLYAFINTKKITG